MSTAIANGSGIGLGVGPGGGGGGGVGVGAGDGVGAGVGVGMFEKMGTFAVTLTSPDRAVIVVEVEALRTTWAKPPASVCISAGSTLPLAAIKVISTSATGRSFASVTAAATKAFPEVVPTPIAERIAMVAGRLFAGAGRALGAGRGGDATLLQLTASTATPTTTRLRMHASIDEVGA
jgi:hypothetical protein